MPSPACAILLWQLVCSWIRFPGRRMIVGVSFVNHARRSGVLAIFAHFMFSQLTFVVVPGNYDFRVDCAANWSLLGFNLKVYSLCNETCRILALMNSWSKDTGIWFWFWFFFKNLSCSLDTFQFSDLHGLPRVFLPLDSSNKILSLHLHCTATHKFCDDWTGCYWNQRHWICGLFPQEWGVELLSSRYAPERPSFWLLTSVFLY